MCAPGSACGCGGAASDLGGGVAMLIAGAVAVGGVVAFLAAHLVLLALAAVALPVATLATVRYLRRYVIVVHKQPSRPAPQIVVATPALGRPRAAIARPNPAVVQRPALARPHPALPQAALAQPVPAVGTAAAAQLSMGGYHLHFHGVSAAEVAALLRRDGEPAPLRREDVTALPAAEGRARGLTPG